MIKFITKLNKIFSNSKPESNSKTFWQNLKNQKINESNKKGLNYTEPILALAPMADVTDHAFRKLFAKYGKPDVLWTEFVSADGICLAPKEGREKILKDLKFDKSQHPIVAQIFGSDLENLEKTARLVYEMGFDGIDINMGCPDRSIEKQGCGSAMIKNPELAVQVIKAVQKGVGFEKNIIDGKEVLKTKIPVTVKTRLGYNQDQLEEWLPVLLSTNPAVVTIHARTRKEMSKVPARWERIKRAVEIRDSVQSDLAPEQRTLIFGNGDIDSVENAHLRAKETGADGVMIGRGIFGKPWFFNFHTKESSFGELGQKIIQKTPSLKKRLNILIEHAELFDKYIGHKNFAVMRKHFKAYVEGFDGAKELRIELMETQNSREVRCIVKRFIKERGI
jgi:nifR3 family TIM-barrel protein